LLRDLWRAATKLARSPIFWSLIAVDIVAVFPLTAWLNETAGAAVPSGNPTTTTLADFGQFVLLPLSVAVAALSVAMVLDSGRARSVLYRAFSVMGMAVIQVFIILLVGFISLTVTQAVGMLAYAPVVLRVVFFATAIWSGMVVAESARSGIGGAFRAVNSRFRQRFWAWFAQGLVIVLSGQALMLIVPSTSFMGAPALGLPLVWMVACFSLVTFAPKSEVLY